MSDLERKRIIKEARGLLAKAGEILDYIHRELAAKDKKAA